MTRTKDKSDFFCLTLGIENWTFFLKNNTIMGLYLTTVG